MTEFTYLFAEVTLEDVDPFLRKVKELVHSLGVELQVVDQKVVASEVHLMSATAKAHRAFQNQTAAARSVGLETLLYLTGERQIADALRAGGVKTGARKVVVLAYGKVDWDPIARALKLRVVPQPPAPGRDRLIELGFTEDQLKSVIGPLEDLLLERAALVDLTKG